MKKQIFGFSIFAIFYIFFSLVISHCIFAQSEWTQKDRDELHKSLKIESEAEFKSLYNSSKDDAKRQASELLLKNIDPFCDCVIQKLEKSFPKRKDFLNLNESAKKNKIQKISKSVGSECGLEVVNNDYEKSRKILIQSCVKGYKNENQMSFSTSQMEQYCACTIDKYYAKEKSFSKLLGKTTDEVIALMESEISECFKFLKSDTLSGNSTGTKLNWTPALERIFVKSCAENFDNPRGKNYCECMIEEIKIKYPKYEDFEKIAGNQEKFLSEFSEEVLECSKLLKENDSNTSEATSSDKTKEDLKWSPALEKIFLKSCTENLDDRGNKKYCNCMLDKIKTKYPKYQDFVEVAGDQEKLLSDLQDEIVECAKLLKNNKSKE